MHYKIYRELIIDGEIKHKTPMATAGNLSVAIMLARNYASMAGANAGVYLVDRNAEIKKYSI